MAAKCPITSASIAASHETEVGMGKKYRFCRLLSQHRAAKIMLQARSINTERSNPLTAL